MTDYTWADAEREFFAAMKERTGAELRRMMHPCSHTERTKLIETPEGAPPLPTPKACTWCNKPWDGHLPWCAECAP